MHVGLYILTSVIIVTPTTTYTFPFGEEASRHYAVTRDRIPKGLHIRPSCRSNYRQHEESSLVGDPTDIVQSPPPHLTSVPAGHSSSDSDERSPKTPEGGEGNEGSSGEGTPPTMNLHSIPDVLSEGNRADETVRFVKPTTGICGFPPAGQNLSTMDGD